MICRKSENPLSWIVGNGSTQTIITVHNAGTPFHWVPESCLAYSVRGEPLAYWAWVSHDCTMLPSDLYRARLHKLCFHSGSIHDDQITFYSLETGIWAEGEICQNSPFQNSLFDLMQSNSFKRKGVGKLLMCANLVVQLQCFSGYPMLIQVTRTQATSQIFRSTSRAVNEQS